MNCRHCGSSEVDEDRRRGDTVCMGCGAVLEEGMIVNEVEFQENAGGAASVIGQFVSTDDTGTSGAFASKLGVHKESRQVTLENAKRRLQQVGSQLRLNQHCIDMAFNFYKTILSRGWTRGRKVNYVIAACLYIVCRTEGTHHMLLDLSDVLQVNVYVLGHSYLELARRLCISIPALDPCLYIQRFAQKLELGEKTREVESTALRLLQRMKKDWISTGRRPAGLAAAALLVASRLHDFNRNFEDVARIAKISEQTARKRLVEFARTPTSALSIDDFLQVDYEEEYDPPAFYEGLKRVRPLPTDEKEMTRLGAEVEELQRRIDSEIAKLQARRSGMYSANNSSSSTVAAADVAALDDEPDGVPSSATFGVKRRLCNILSTDVESEVNLSEKYILRDALEGVVDTEELDSCVDELHTAMVATGGAMDESTAAALAAAKSGPDDEQLGRSDSSTELQLVDGPAVARTQGSDQQTGAQAVEKILQTCGLRRPDGYGTLCVKKEHSEYVDVGECASGELDLTGIDDDELDKEYILTRKEVLIKARDWYKKNIDYLRYMKEKEEQRRLQEEEEAKNPSAKKKRRSNRKSSSIKPTESADDAIEQVIKAKKISNKIDYEALKRLTAPLVPAAPTDSQLSGTNQGLVKLEAKLEALVPEVPPSVVPSKLGEDLLKLMSSGGASLEPLPTPVVRRPLNDDRKRKMVPLEVTPPPLAQHKAEVDVDQEDEDEEIDDDDDDDMDAAQLLRKEGAGDYGAGAIEEEYDNYDDQYY